MAILKTYDDGNRLEDVMKMVITITPTDTPFMSGIKKKKANNTWHQWPRDVLTTRQDNAVVEGNTFATATHTPPTRSGNVTQIFEKSIDVSSTERWVKQAGIDNMYDYEKNKKIKEISTDVEHALLRGSLNTGNNSVARRLAGVLNYISTNISAVASGTKLTESFFCGMLQLCWNAGGNPNEVYVGGFLKRVISSYTAGSTRNVDSDDKRLTNAVDVYESDFGLIKTFLCRDMLTGAANCSIIIIENSRWAMAMGEEIHELPKEEVAQTKHGKTGEIRGELTLESLAEEANAQVTGLDQSFN